MTSPETFSEFRTIFAKNLRQSGFSDFDLSVAATEKRALTQAIGLWAYQQDYQGIHYVTRHTPALHCWAIFEGTEFVVIDPGSAILVDDPDLAIVASQWGLSLPD